MERTPPESSSSMSSRWLRFAMIGAGVAAVVALTGWCAAAVMNDDSSPAEPGGAQTATPAAPTIPPATIAATASPTSSTTTAASPAVATATTAPAGTATVTAQPTATPGRTTAPAQPTAAPTNTAAPPTNTATPTSTTAPAQPTATPTPATLPNRTGTYKFALKEFASTLTLSFDFAAGMVTGTLSGTRTQLITNTCYSGGQLLETAEAAATSVFSSVLSASVAPTGGPFSSPADITGTTTYAITRPFTHPSCLGGNQVPAPVPFGGFGTVSGVVPASGPVSFSVNTTVGNYSQ